jgi:hypothetical protein
VDAGELGAGELGFESLLPPEPELDSEPEEPEDPEPSEEPDFPDGPDDAPARESFR